MNQDRIKDRILRRASRLWGYNELESENSFDPIVGLLLSAKHLNWSVWVSLWKILILV